MDRLTYGLTDSPLGRLLVACTPRGVCAVAFADEDDLLRDELHSRYPVCELHEDAAAMAEHLTSIVESLQQGTELSLLLDVPGTPFQHAVWAALRSIPYGVTRTYAQLAAALGRPASAARAVARACAANPVAIAIPCHRVVGGDGSLTGYRWGVERKHWLLQQEQQAVMTRQPREATF